MKKYYRCLYEVTDRYINRETDKQTDRQIDRQYNI